jgi:hypothetical protein
MREKVEEFVSVPREQSGLSPAVFQDIYDAAINNEESISSASERLTALVDDINELLRKLPGRVSNDFTEAITTDVRLIALASSVCKTVGELKEQVSEASKLIDGLQNTIAQAEKCAKRVDRSLWIILVALVSSCMFVAFAAWRIQSSVDQPTSSPPLRHLVQPHRQ